MSSIFGKITDISQLGYGQGGASNTFLGAIPTIGSYSEFDVVKIEPFNFKFNINNAVVYVENYQQIQTVIDYSNSNGNPIIEIVLTSPITFANVNEYIVLPANMTLSGKGKAELIGSDLTNSVLIYINGDNTGINGLKLSNAKFAIQCGTIGNTRTNFADTRIRDCSFSDIDLACILNLNNRAIFVSECKILVNGTYTFVRNNGVVFIDNCIFDTSGIIIVDYDATIPQAPFAKMMATITNCDCLNISALISGPNGTSFDTGMVTIENCYIQPLDCFILPTSVGFGKLRVTVRGCKIVSNDFATGGVFQYYNPGIGVSNDLVALIENNEFGTDIVFNAADIVGGTPGQLRHRNNYRIDATGGRVLMPDFTN